MKRLHTGRRGRRSRPATRRSASSLIRTLVVAATTLAILLVCFSMYQYSQIPLADSQLASRPPRLPLTPTEPASPQPSAGASTVAGVPVGQGVIGPGQNITITIYPREGTRAQMELSVRDWVPKPGSDHEFLLTHPEVRLRTKDGNDVRVTAREGVLDAQRKTGGGLDPRRGELSGDVVIEFDRRTDKDKAALPAAMRERIDPAELVRVETDRLEFDIEYAKLVTPGRIHLTARDVEWTVEDLEIRFNEAQSRVESLRVARGGRLEIADVGGQFALKVPGAEREASPRTTLVDWLRATIEARATAATAQPSKPTPTAANPDDVPVFRTAEKDKRTQPQVRYLAKFDGDIDARQVVDGTTRSRLQADSLEVLRDFSDADKDKVRSSASPAIGAKAPTSAAPGIPSERITLEWTGRLVVDALAADDPRADETTRSRITAVGQPARLTHPEGETLCRRLDYQPDDGLIRLIGDADDPITVRSVDQDVMTGVSASVQRQGDAMEINVVGPGTLSSAGAATSSGSYGTSVIEFADRLDASGRFVTRTTLDLLGGVSTRQQRVLDKAAFAGRVRVRDGETSVEADSLDAAFAEQGGRQGRPALTHVTGSGNVVMVQNNDRITCETIDVDFETGADGQSRPRSAQAKGNVFATQGERTLQATDSLAVDFESAAGTASDPRGEPSAPRVQTAVRRIRASGAVAIHAPNQSLDISASQLDCTLSGAREIDKAVLLGTAERPAHAQMDTLTVTGQRIDLDVPNQWAEVPGPGRLSFLSKKDLDGGKRAKPVPIVVTWSKEMKFHGRENRGVFDGHVHATSESTTTFDCDHQLIVEFVDAPPAEKSKSAGDWNLLRPLIGSVFGKSDDSKIRLGHASFSKEPVYLLADGNAVAETSEVDPDSGVLASRSRISGPRLSVTLRSETSRMLIEGPGDLQLEDFRPPSPATQAGETKPSDLFQVGEDSGASKTLVEWRDRMWYDFSVAQTRFEGGVQLRHFSGAELEKLFEMSSTKALPPGRATFLNCDVLTVDFADRDARATDAGGRRSARLSGDRLRQFQASGAVVLQDQIEGLSVSADSVVYERPRQLLAISGTKQRKAQITVRKPGKMPNQVSTERLFYNLATGKLELVQTTVKGQ